HSKIHEELEKQGVTDDIRIWIKGWLEDREARVKYGNMEKWCGCYARGCPQGSVLSPALFVLVTEALGSSVVSAVGNERVRVRWLSYADDSYLLMGWGKKIDPSRASRSVKEATEKIAETAARYGLRLETTKTNIFTNRAQWFEGIDGPIICKELKVLGILLTASGSFLPHVRYRVGLARQCTNRMMRYARANSGLSPNLCKLLYMKIFIPTGRRPSIGRPTKEKLWVEEVYPIGLYTVGLRLRASIGDITG
ncbi:hypothetical protein FOZ63_016238, partial [Perkinsus olseni]